MLPDIERIVVILVQVLAMSGSWSGRGGVEALQSSDACAPVPTDKRQTICTCVRLMQIKCTFNSAIREIDASLLDKSLRVIRLSDMSLDTAVASRLLRKNDGDADDETEEEAEEDMEAIGHVLEANPHFETTRMRYHSAGVAAAAVDESRNESEAGHSSFLYFPDFSAPPMSLAYTKLHLDSFVYVPSFAFASSTVASGDARTRATTRLSSLVFELNGVREFAMDAHALAGTHVESLLLEGPFHQLVVHADAFVESRVDELTIGCYCIECETFEGACLVKFNHQQQRHHQQPSSLTSSSSARIKSLKLFGAKLTAHDRVRDPRWNLDSLPGREHLERLEIANARVHAGVSDADAHNHTRGGESSEPPNSDLRFAKLTELVFVNNQLAQLSKQLLCLFPALVACSFAHNQLTAIEPGSFACNADLRQLNLNHNRLHRVHRHTFNAIATLRSLSLRHNRIERVDDYAFANLAALDSLDLTSNRLTALGEHTFDGLRSLRELLLSNNPLKSIDAHAFRYVALASPMLRRLDIVSDVADDDAGWFVFDDADLCLLGYFTCRVALNFNTDQRCNCFSRLASSLFQDNQVAGDNGDGDKSPCVFQQSTLVDADVDELADAHRSRFTVKTSLGFRMAADHHRRLDDLDDETLGESCRQKAYEACFASLNDSSRQQLAAHNSCLFNAVSPPPRGGGEDTTTTTTATTTTVPSEKAAVAAATEKTPLVSSSSSSSSKQGQRATTSVVVVADLNLAQLVSDLRQHPIMFVLAALGVLSVSSCLISIYLFARRRRYTIVYHPTKMSPYPTAATNASDS